QPVHREAPAAGHGSGQGTDEPQPAGNRGCFRRAGSHHGTACLPANRRAPGKRQEGQRRLVEFVENSDRIMWITRAEVWAAHLPTGDAQVAGGSYTVSWPVEENLKGCL